MIHFLPLEPIDSRYTKQMTKWIEEGFKRNNVAYTLTHGEPLGADIDCGEVLDAVGTNYYKATQLQEICRKFKRGFIQDGDKFFAADLWYPGLEMIKYIATQLNIDVEIYGYHHAGVFDPNDFTHKMKDWAMPFEIGWLKMCKKVFVGSNFHRHLITDGRCFDNIVVTGGIWDMEDVRSMIGVQEKKRKVIFPHRVDKEKNPEAFIKLAKSLRGNDIEFVITTSRAELTSNIAGLEIPKDITVKIGLTKEEYYKELASSKVMFSSAYQETFGYTLHESMAFNTIPICPNRLCYPEALQNDVRLLYNSQEEAQEKVLWALDNEHEVSNYTKVYSKNMDKIVKEMEV